MRRRAALVSLGIAAGLASALASAPARSAGLDCGPPPAPHPEADAVLTQAIVSPQLETNAATALASAVRRLRNQGVPRAVIVDRAVATYCPMVARDESLTLDRQREAVRRFASTLTSLVYDPLDPTQSETAFILSLPVKPELSLQIDAAAAKAGTTRDAWILEAIQARLAGD
ncbi:hypothetical protein [Methylobacterium sp. R2-1]|uniref:hypothetical protein n=1 Tax=Methylobacterium sp. R2-1 TaxID=2587064 RepID=UPI00160EE4CB|nr:hypothetical protein [Methylobacterium sp. R2-1]MBB2962505.1 hypothetical protein [Methylobacterium sp. R2-1]